MINEVEDYTPTHCQGLGLRKRLRTAKKDRMISMPTMSATKSLTLAVRSTKSWVSSSKMPITEIARKMSKAESIVNEVLTEIRKRNVINP